MFWVKEVTSAQFLKNALEPVKGEFFFEFFFVLIKFLKTKTSKKKSKFFFVESSKIDQN